MTALVITKGLGSLKPSLMMWIVTGVSLGPRMSATASVSCISFVALSPILTILSPESRPALCAGVSSIGATTVRTLSFRPISMPIPPKLPLVSICISLYSSGVMKLEWGSRFLTMPFKEL